MYNKLSSMQASLRPFCRENIDYILENPKYEKNMLDIVKTGSLPSLLKFIEWKYFDKKHPENRNVKIDTDPDNFQVYTSKGWKIVNKYDMVQQMYERIADDIDNFLSVMRENAIVFDTKKFVKKIAQPLRFDMLNVEISDAQDDDEPIEFKVARQSIYDKTLKLFETKATNPAETP